MKKQERRQHTLRPNARCEIPELHILFDTETYPEVIDEKSEYQRLKLGWGVFWDRGGNNKKEREEWFYFTEASSFWRWVFSHIHKGKKVTLWAHNMDFDFRTVEGFKYMKEEGYDIGNPIMDSNLVIINAYKPGFGIRILDTWNYYKGGLADLGEQLGHPKGEIDFKTCSMEELSIYCKNDVFIILQYVKNLLHFIEINQLGNFQPTIAGLGMAAYKHKFMKTPIYVHTNRDAIAMERKAYRGGRTEAFFLGNVEKFNLAYVDVNSMYPYVMSVNTFPYKLIGIEYKPSISLLEKMMERYGVIADVEYEITEPCIALKKKRLLFPIGRMRETLTTPEIELIKQHGRLLRVHRFVKYEMSMHLKDYALYFYHLKQESDKKGDNVSVLFAKYMLNALHGKFGQKNPNVVEVRKMLPGEKEGCVFCVDADTGKRHTETKFQGSVTMQNGFTEGYDSFVAIGSFITGYSRCYLWSLMMKAGIENVFYCDTDSLMIAQEGFKNLESYIDKYELGKLKVEDKQIIEIIGAKSYITNKGRNTKGVKKDSIEIEPEVFEQTQFERLKTGIRKGRVNVVVTKKVKKVMANKYLKGEVDSEGKVYPYFLDDCITPLGFPELKYSEKYIKPPEAHTSKQSELDSWT